MLRRVDRKMGGGLTIHDYEMPIAAHIAWCEWCDETLEEETSDEDLSDD
jgi:hypothetical protein